MMPNFLIIGAPRCGTTFIYHGLQNHPEVFMSQQKEPMFFDFMGNEKNGVFRGVNYLFKTIESYENLFSGVTHEKAVGEASTIYLYSPRAHINIHRSIPDVKLIAVLRNPIDRAYSHFLQQVMRGSETSKDFYEAFIAGEERMRMGWSPFHYYRDMGMYSRQIERYQSVFDHNQLRFYLFEDLRSTPAKIFKDIFEYINVDADIEVDSSGQHSPSGFPKNRFLHRFLYSPNAFKDIVKGLIPQKMHYRLHLYLLGLNLVKPKLGDDLRYRLLAQFEQDIYKTQELIGRDLTFWLE